MARLSFWIDGQPPRKSNSRRIGTRKRNDGSTHPIVFKSQAALNWVEAALLQVPDGAKLELGSLDRPLIITMHVYYKTRRPDLSGELVLDTLQKAGVIKDDRYVYEWHLYKHIDRDRPGVLVEIDYLTERNCI